MRQSTIALTILALLGAASAALAEMAPQFRREAQDGAPEALMIQVTKVREWCRGEDCSFDVRARVMCALRSKSGLKPGDEVRIRYTSDFGALASTVPRVAEGATIPAFLAESSTWWKGKSYVPAAHSATFSPLLDVTKEPRKPDPRICEF